MSEPTAPRPPQQPTPPPAPTGRGVGSNKLALVALIAAVVAFVFGLIPFVGFLSWLIAVGAIVVAIIGITRPRLPKGMAIAALIVGAIALVVGPAVSVGSVIALSTRSAAVSASPRTAAAATPTAKTYVTVEDLKTAFVAAGGDCPSWSQDDLVTLADESGNCSDSVVLMTFKSNSSLEAQKTVLAGTKLPSESFLVGPNWIVNSHQSLDLANKLGGEVVIGTSEDTEDAAPDASTFSYEDAGLEASLKTTKKQCFGSAGCNVTAKVELALNDVASVPDDASGSVTFEITGVEDGPVIDTIEITGTSYSVPTELLSTSSSSAKPKIKITDITTN